LTIFIGTTGIGWPFIGQGQPMNSDADVLPYLPRAPAGGIFQAAAGFAAS
jgi:hypothetical protein